MNILPGPDYAAFLADLKTRIVSARARATLAVNAELIRLYHHIGLEIARRQKARAWGDKVIHRLADDLKTSFPDFPLAISNT